MTEIKCPKQYGSYDISNANCSQCRQGHLYQLCQWQDGDMGPKEHPACAGWNIRGVPYCCFHYKQMMRHD